MPDSDRGVVAGATDVEAAAMDAARALARTIGESVAFRAFEEARDTLMADATMTRRLRSHQRRRQAFETARSWNGADSREADELEAEWRVLAEIPAIREYLRTQDELVMLLREVAALISQELGMDYASACAPAGGCCG